MAAIALLWAASACNAEAHDPGKEAFCYGMDELAVEARAGEVTRQEVFDRIQELVAEGRQSPDEDFVDDIEKYLNPEAPVSVINDIAEACSDYIEIDGVF